MANKNFVVYKSSAGSGKTFTLVKEFLKLALANKYNLTKDYKTILAVTFTNKAASEMKWRVIKALQEISNDKNEFLTQLIASELNISTYDLKERAEIVLTDVLHNYSDLSIGTIDSFTHRIIKTFALDLHLPINFQIEMDEDLVFKKIISLLIGNLGKDKLITDYLVDFTLSQIDDNKSWDPEQLLLDFIKEANKEGVDKMLKQLSHYEISHFETIKKQLREKIKNYQSHLKQLGEKALNLIHSHSLTVDSFYQSKSGMYNFYKKLVEGEKISLEELFNSYVLEALNEDKWYTKTKVSATDKASIESIKDELKAIALQVEKHINEQQKQYVAHKLILKNVYAMGLVNELAKLTETYKTDENILFMSEFNTRISDVISDEPTPFIFERLGNRYNHFLLDEFQDTSATQWKNMLPLIDDSLAKDKLNLIVGDGKQSIYRWRNANVEQFVSLPHIVSEQKNSILVEREQSLIRNFKEEFLVKNFRSQSTIVNFNNALFDFLAPLVLNEKHQKIYFKQAQETSVNIEGFVSIDFPIIESDTKDEINLNYVLQYIQQAKTDNYDYADICIIVDTNKNGSTIANYLISQGIPVTSKDSLLLQNATEITVIESFLKYISNQKNGIAAATVIQYIYEKGSCNNEQYLSYLRSLNSGTTLYAILNLCSISISEHTLKTSNLFDSCMSVCKALKLQEYNAQYIRFFLDEVLTYLQNNTSNIALFLNWWERKKAKASVIIPEGINAVNIMTIHASKGLEFPIVITPYMNKSFEKAKPIWVEIKGDEIDLPVALINTNKEAEQTDYVDLVQNEKQEQILDSLNMLYVDFTRAVDRLHIISPYKPSKENLPENNTNTWLQKFALQQPQYNSEKKQLVLGELNPKKNNHRKNELEQLFIPELHLTNNEEAIQIKSASSFLSSEEVTKAREYGILVHYILSQIKTKKDISLAVNNAILSGDITEQEATKISGEIETLISLPKITAYFKEDLDIKNELEILTVMGNVLRPDRVIANGNTATVIDYKTGKKQSQKYHLQMQDYELALKELGFQSIKKIILYIADKDVEELN